MLTVESPSEVGIVVLCDILEATRSQGDDLQVCLRQNGGEPLAFLEVFLHQAPDELGEGDPLGPGLGA